MTPVMHRPHLAAILAFVAVIFGSVPQVASPANATWAPHNAFEKRDRDDLNIPLREHGEIRVVVGLQTPAEVAQQADSTRDDVKEQRVAARQLRVLQRLARQNLRHLRQLRHHPFMAVTVDAAGLAALLADPEVTSVTEDRPVYLSLKETPTITRADKAWAEGYRGAGQTVAVIDTGVDKNHPFFGGKIVAEACFSTPGQNLVSFCPG